MTSNTKTFNFIKALIKVLSVCTDEVLTLTSDFQNGISTEPTAVDAGVLTPPATNSPLEPVAAIPPIDLDQLNTARTVYPAAINLYRK